MTMTEFHNILKKETLRIAEERKASLGRELTEDDKRDCLRNAQLVPEVKEAYKATKQKAAWVAIGKIVKEQIKVND